MKKLLQDTLRQIKRLKTLGRLEFEIVNYTDKNFNMMIDIFLNKKKIDIYQQVH